MTLAALFDRIGAACGPLLRPIGVRLNPILVKEIRQSLRGRYFQVAFSLMVVLATILACGMLVFSGLDPQEDTGVVFFVGMYVLLSIAVNVFVPFHAFLSVGSEWEENTFDLLVLSNLTPLQIVLGKLFSAQIQVLLFFSAFGPFLIFAFLLRGLDLEAAAWVLGLSLVSSSGLICVAICLSSLVTNRFGRVMLMVFQAALLLVTCGWSIAFTSAAFFERFVHTPQFVQVALILVSLAVAVGSFALVLGATRFTHPEENRSTGLRVLASLGVVVGLGWTAYLFDRVGNVDVLAMCTLGLFVAVTLLGIPFCAEEERLGRRVRLHVPRSRLAGLLVQPWLPGGGRGVLLYLVHVTAIALGVALIARGSWTASSSFLGERVMVYPIGMLAYLAIYLLLPTGLLSRWTGKLSTRVIARVLVPVTAAFTVVLPILVGFLIGSPDLSRGRHPGNPAHVLERVARGGDDVTPAMLAVLAVLGLTLLLNAPRVARSFGELARARRDRLEREARAGGAALSARGGSHGSGGDALPES